MKPRQSPIQGSVSRDEMSHQFQPVQSTPRPSKGAFGIGDEKQLENDRWEKLAKVGAASALQDLPRGQRCDEQQLQSPFSRSARNHRRR